MEFNDILYAKKVGVARVTINREKVMNALREKRKPNFRAVRDCKD